MNFINFVVFVSCLVTASVAQHCPKAVECLPNSTNNEETPKVCGFYSSAFPCLAGLGDLCDVDETTVTFNNVTALAHQICRELKDFDLDCEAYKKCLAQTELLKTFKEASYYLEAISDILVDANFWCRFLEEVASCMVTASAGCSLGTDVHSRAEVLRNRLTATCSHPGTGCDTFCQERCTDTYTDCLSPLANLTGGAEGVTCDNIHTVPDTCKTMQHVTTCLTETLSDECLTFGGYKAAVKTFEERTDLSCSVTAVCNQQMEKCQCHLQSNPNDPCKGYQKALQCIDNLPPECSRDPTAKDAVKYLRTSAFVLNYTHCDPKGGVCPDTMKCLSGNRGRNRRQAIATTTKPTQEDSCSTVPMLECLERASTKCKIDQGTVSFEYLREFSQDLCTGQLPDPDVLDSCREYVACQNAVLPKVPDVGEIDQGSRDPDTLIVYAHLLASMTRTGFWCKLLESSFKCAVDNAEVCQLEESYVTFARQQYERFNSICAGAATVAPLIGDGGVTVATTTAGNGNIVLGNEPWAYLLMLGLCLFLEIVTHVISC